MKLEYYNQGASGSAVATIEPAGPGASRLTISPVKAGADDGQGVALRFKDFKDGTLIEGTPDPAYAMPLPGGRIDDLVFNLGDEVTNALVRNRGSNNTICVEADGIGDVRTLVAGELKLGADKPKAAPAQPFASAAPEAPQAAPAAATSAAPVQKKGRGALIAIIIAILLLLAIAAFAAWWFLLRPCLMLQSRSRQPWLRMPKRQTAIRPGIRQMSRIRQMPRALAPMRPMPRMAVLSRDRRAIRELPMPRIRRSSPRISKQKASKISKPRISSLRAAWSTARPWARTPMQPRPHPARPWAGRLPAPRGLARLPPTATIRRC